MDASLPGGEGRAHMKRLLPALTLLSIAFALSVGSAAGQQCEEGADSCEGGGAAPPPDYSTATPIGDDLYKVLDRGLPFRCDASDCTIKATVSVSKAVARYLRLSSRTLASGTPTGPTTAVIGERRQHNVFFLKLPSSFERKVKARHVVTMKVKVKLTADFAAKYAPGGRWHSSYPDPDDLSDLQLGQGSRYGCAPKAGGAIIVGYNHFGGKCPK